jgi:hypothetical protein
LAFENAARYYWIVILAPSGELTPATLTMIG